VFETVIRDPTIAPSKLIAASRRLLLLGASARRWGARREPPEPRPKAAPPGRQTGWASFFAASGC